MGRPVLEYARERKQAGNFGWNEVLWFGVVAAVLLWVVGSKTFTSGRTCGPSRVTSAKTDIGMTGLALDAFQADCGRYPTDAEGLAALMRPPPALAAYWRGPYIKSGVPPDPWGRPYVYHAPTPLDGSVPYRLCSTGPDGVEGTADDLRNW